MLGEIFGIALQHVPFALLLGLAVYVLFWWGLQQRDGAPRTAAKAILIVVVLAAAAGLVCGALTFAGVFSSSDMKDFYKEFSLSTFYFGADYREKGAVIIYLSVAAFAGMGAALLSGRHAARRGDA